MRKLFLTHTGRRHHDWARVRTRGVGDADSTAMPAFTQNTSGMQGMKMDQSMSGMKMHQNMPCMKTGKDMPMNGMPTGASSRGMPMDKGMRMGKNMPCASQTAKGTGVVETIDTAKGTVTIKHQAIASIQRPAMTDVQGRAAHLAAIG